MITLNECEQRMAKFLARSRFEANRKRGTVDKKVGPQSTWETDLEGIAAEIAFCRIHNVYPDTQLDQLLFADAFTRQMGSVDVKATKYRNGKLLAVAGKVKNPPDAYALMVGQFPAYRFAGWVTADAFLRAENIQDLGYGPTFALEQSELQI